MQPETIRLPESLWAAVTPPGPELPQLAGAEQADVVIIGAGFTGLSTALHLREAGVVGLVHDALAEENPDRLVEAAHRPANGLLLARRGRLEDERRGFPITEKQGLRVHHELLGVREANAADDER